MDEQKTEQLSDERDVRLQKLEQMYESGIEPYPADVKTDFRLHELRRNFELLSGRGDSVTVAGRVMSKRMHGKSAFSHIQDGTDKFQLYFRYDTLGEESYQFFKKMVDVGDFIEVAGTLFRTKTGEETVQVERFRLISKAVLPLPEKWHGLADEDLKLRFRYLDILMNAETKERFIKRAKLLRAMRDYLDEQGYLEVETPVLQPLYGGANARPFDTHHNALDMKLYLRIATELYLKRLIIGGMDRIYEIGRNFRNEGIDRMHNPEFTCMEVYRAYADYEDMMALAQGLLRNLAETVGARHSSENANSNGHTSRNALPLLQVSYQGVETDLSAPFQRIHFWEAIEKATGKDLSDASRKELVEYLKSEGIEFAQNAPWHILVDEVFKEKVERTLIAPTFIIDYPTEISPLAKHKRDCDDEKLVERFELFWFGMEIANAFTELNNPVEQRRRFEAQMDNRAKGDPEAQALDEDFITALEHGMPPTAGMGMGIDRIAMILTDTYSIRDVILFPLLRMRSAL